MQCLSPSDVCKNHSFVKTDHAQSIFKMKGRVNLSEESVSSSNDSEGSANRVGSKRSRDSVSPSSNPTNESGSKETTCNLDEYKHYYKGVEILYNVPVDSHMPEVRWRIYVFKDGENEKPWFIHRQQAYLFGRDRRIADIPIDHPSCSKQHAVLQYRKIPTDQEDEYVVKPYLMDLGSANGTFINDKKITPRKYYEILHSDLIRFAYSTREYVFINAEIAEEKSKN